MTGKIYWLPDEQTLQTLAAAQFESESRLQEILASNPELLAGEQIDSRAPRRWLLVAREMVIETPGEGAGRWSLDHLFLDQDGIPTLVEVKRSRDSRVRREVVGQVLDYAASAVVSWRAETIEAAFRRQCETSQLNAEEVLRNFLGDSLDANDFWSRVSQNLINRDIRLIFVADRISPELRRVVELLNEEMNRFEVLALEIQHYRGPGGRVLVPRVYGHSELGQQRRSNARKWEPDPEISLEEFLDAFSYENSPSSTSLVRQLIDWGLAAGLRVWSRGSPQRTKLFVSLFRQDDSGEIRLCEVDGRGRLVIPMRQLSRRPPFDNSAKREEFGQLLCSLGPIKTTDHGMTGFPTLELASVTNPEPWPALRRVLDWLHSAVRSSD